MRRQDKFAETFGAGTEYPTDLMASLLFPAPAPTTLLVNP
jgi:hypothetical protein